MMIRKIAFPPKRRLQTIEELEELLVVVITSYKRLIFAIHVIPPAP